MAIWRLWSCDGFTGQKLDVLPLADGSWKRLLSAGSGQESITIPLEADTDTAWVKILTLPWEHILVLERDGVPVYGGYVSGRSYDLGGSKLVCTVYDLWQLLGMRGAWDRSAPYTASWSQIVTGTLGVQAWHAIHRGRNTGHYPAQTAFPVSLGTTGLGGAIPRPYYGYHFEKIADVWAGLMDEGLDIYLKPRWNGNFFEWQFHASPGWVSGRTVELMVSVENPDVVKLSESADGIRMTSNAIRLGEGSEVDMLARSRQNFAAPFVVLDRVTAAKTVSDVGQLDGQALGDLALYGQPTVQWDLQVPASTDIDVGDTARVHVSGDQWIGDGWHTRRVVKVSGGLGDTKTVGVQPVGGG